MDINQIKLDNKFKLVEASAGTGKSFTLAHIVDVMSVCSSLTIHHDVQFLEN